MGIFSDHDKHLKEIPIHLRSPSDSYAVGKELRQKCPRSEHAQLDSHDRHPMELLHSQDGPRLKQLLPIRYERMGTSPFAFYRGAAIIMAEDLSHTPTSGLIVQSCGDAHLMNFGGFATPERKIIFDINDFDETYAAPFEWDLKRLATSLMIAGQFHGFPDKKCRKLTRSVVRVYQRRMREIAKMDALYSWYAAREYQQLINSAMDRSLVSQAQKQLAKAIQRDTHFEYAQMTHAVKGNPQIIDAHPLVFHPDESIHPDFVASSHRALAQYRQSLSLEKRVLLDRYELVDVAMKVVGVGSVGTFCAVALFMAGKGDPLFLQIKEAQPSVLERHHKFEKFKTHGERVVFGQRLMQAATDLFLGHFEGDSGRHYYVRQLRDVKVSLNLEKIDYKGIEEYGQNCALALAHAHSRSGNPAMIAGYMGKSDLFAEAIADFALEYARLNTQDYGLLKAESQKKNTK